MTRDDHDTHAGGGRTGPVSLFGTGQRRAPSPVLLDHPTGRELFLSNEPSPELNPVRVWESVTPFNPDVAALAARGLFVAPDSHPAAASFDILRTRILKAMAKNGWTRLAVTSPTHGCGKSLVAANLALSLARVPSSRAVLMDLELRAPQLAAQFGLEAPGALSEFLTGEQPLEALFRRIGRNLSLGLNGEPVPEPAQLLHDPEFARAMAAMRELLQPDLVVIDMAPALGSEDLLALADQLDAVLLVTDGTHSSPAEISATERLLGEARLPLLGVVLNRAQDRGERHRYGQR